MNLLAIAKRLDAAARTATAVPQLATTGDDVSLEGAYAVQSMSMAERVTRGERIIGAKMGFTSRAKMVQMGVSDLIFGQLTSGMLLEDGGVLDLEQYVHPRIEPEIAFRLCRPVTGTMTLADAILAIDAVAPALEVIDSRYRNFKFSLSDVVADNCSSSGVVIGAFRPVPADLSNLGMIMRFNGRAVEAGSSAGILGNPWRSVIAAGRLADRYGIRLEPGHILLAGAATAAQQLSPDLHVGLEVEGLGRVEITVGGHQP